jgi:hypothetical protein
MKEPTSEQCSEHEIVDRGDGWTAVAIWYPQMGGYVGKCVVRFGNEPQSCFDAWVWHDGEFPFGTSAGDPVQIHHCDPEQFVRFGDTVRRLTAETAARDGVD